MRESKMDAMRRMEILRKLERSVMRRRAADGICGSADIAKAGTAKFDGANMMTEKQVLRKQKKMCRDALSPQEHESKSAQLCDALKNHPLCKAARFVYCYAPLGSEADIWPVVEWLWKSGRRVAFPRVTGDGAMEFFEVRGREELREGSFHVMEPGDADASPVDWEGALVLVPLVAFAADGTRCGYGKGYYDRYFALHPNLVRLGVGFSCQRCEELRFVCEESDERLDYVQTEDTCYDALQTFSYEKMADKICGSRRFGRAPGVECSGALMELLSHPERGLSFVHIAGTNGKGSVAAFLREICVQEGVRAGLFTSPHLQSFTERIQIGHTEISREDVLRLGRQVLACDHLLMVRAGLKCTMFDLCLAIALLYFKEQGVELVILETGMGGRLDSTNCIPAPLVTVITAIGLEHTEYLGDTLEKIAAEKAGILKPGTRAVIMAQKRDGFWRTDDAEKVLTDRCEALGIPYRISGEIDAQGMYELPMHGSRHYEIGMLGAYQRRNAAAALEAAELLIACGEEGQTGLSGMPAAAQKTVAVEPSGALQAEIKHASAGAKQPTERARYLPGRLQAEPSDALRAETGYASADAKQLAEMGYASADVKRPAEQALHVPKALQAKLAGFTPEGMAAGIAAARWPGRMEVVREGPWVMLDGAHNAHGVAALAESLRELDGESRYVFFMGVMAEKDYVQMAELILPLAKHIYTLAPESARALSAKALCEAIRARGGNADVCGSVDEAMALIGAFSPEEKCVIFGSLYLIGEVRERFCAGE